MNVAACNTDSSAQPGSVFVGPGGQWLRLPHTQRLKFRLSASPPNEVICTISEIHDRVGKCVVNSETGVSLPHHSASVARKIHIFNQFNKICCESDGSPFINLPDACNFCEYPRS